MDIGLCIADAVITGPTVRSAENRRPMAWSVILLIQCLCLPYFLNGWAVRAGVAVLLLVLWLVLVKPTWFGLFNFYGTALLALNVLAAPAIALMF